MKDYKKLKDEHLRLTEMYIKLEDELEHCKKTIKTMRSFLKNT